MAKKVLVIDDSADVRQQVGVVLEHAGYEVLEATDGADGLAKLADEPEIRMIILDVNMPRMGGLAMLEKVKAGGMNPDLPVIMLTSEGEQSLIERAKRAGARGWIVKPFKAKLLLAAVTRLLET